MPRAGRQSAAADYDLNVFINCPFDDPCLPMLRALTFAVFECGLRPRCAREVYDAGEVRIQKIGRIIQDCRICGCGLDVVAAGLEQAAAMIRQTVQDDLCTEYNCSRIRSGCQ